MPMLNVRLQNHVNYATMVTYCGAACNVHWIVLNFCRYCICTYIILSAHSIITKNTTTPCKYIIKHVCIHCIRIQCEYNLRTFILSTVDLNLAVRVVSRIRSKSMSVVCMYVYFPDMDIQQVIVHCDSALWLKYPVR